MFQVVTEDLSLKVALPIIELGLQDQVRTGQGLRLQDRAQARYVLKHSKYSQKVAGYYHILDVICSCFYFFIIPNSPF